MAKMGTGLFERLNDPRAGRWAMVVVPLAFGLLSLWLGADRNFDLLNYHLYNAYAFMDHRLEVDLAPASLQSYFNPLPDLLYYGMAFHWPAWLTGFAMGVLHGLNFLLLLFIARRVLVNQTDADRNRLSLLLALAGCLTANFLSELGNSMNDNSTALLELGAVCVLLGGWDELMARSRRAMAIALLAGLLAGIGAGLKLTNAVYAAAGAASFLVLPLPWAARLRLAAVFGVGAAIGLGLIGGFWFLEMWRRYGNPLYPQFGSLFPSPLARPISAGDAHWLPRNLLEVLFWPFIIAWDSRRVGQLELHQVIWPALYVLLLWWGLGRLRRRPANSLDPRQLYLVSVIAFGFVLWMSLFSVYRYLVPIELLAPLAVFVLCAHLFRRGPRVAGWVLGISTAIVVLGGCRTWGHEARAEPLYRADLPALQSPSRTAVLLVGAAQPDAWLAPLFPREVSFIGVRQGFPESPRYAAKVHAMAANKQAFAMVEAHYVWRLDSIAQGNAWAEHLGLTGGPGGCRWLHSIADHLQLHAQVQDTAAGCQLALAPQDQEDTAGEDRASAEKAARLVAGYGFRLDPAACTVYMAHVGQGSYPYQWCPLSDTGVTGGKKNKGRDAD